MQVVVEHKIVDREKFAEADAGAIAGGAPSGDRLQQFLPATDLSMFCLWEAGSIDALRGYLDPATAGITENAYFEIDQPHAIGLPQAAEMRAS
jgi:hypothetical protein